MVLAVTPQKFSHHRVPVAMKKAQPTERDGVDEFFSLQWPQLASRSPLAERYDARSLKKIDCREHAPREPFVGFVVA
jgi:hypothetical protein